jgi:hypothetical protein
MRKSLGSITHAKVIASIPIFWETRRYSVYCPASLYRHRRIEEIQVVDIDYIPEGYKYLGHGVSRMAFLGPDGVVYKRPYEQPDNYGYNYSVNNCVNEAKFYGYNWERFREAGIYLVPCRWFSSVKVLAMEHVDKAKEFDTVPDVFARLSGLGIWDIHRGNVWIDSKDRLVLVDYAN